MFKIDDAVILILIIAIIALSIGLTYDTTYDNVIAVSYTHLTLPTTPYV